MVRPLALTLTLILAQTLTQTLTLTLPLPLPLTFPLTLTLTLIAGYGVSRSGGASTVLLVGAGDGSLSAFRLRADPDGRVAASAWPEHGGTAVG